MKIGIVGGAGAVGTANKEGFDYLKHQVYIHDTSLGTNIQDVYNTEIVYICVPTPSKEDGSCDTSIVESVLDDLNSYAGVIAIRSTVEPGFTNKMIEKYSNDKICFVPEFLHERSAKFDFIENHSLCLIGTNNLDAFYKIRDSHGDLPKHIKQLSPTEAELVKYFNNVYAALRVTFANNMYEICKKLDADYTKIKNTYVLTGKTMNKYLDCNDDMRGYAGMCLPKDTKALIHLMKKLNIDLDLIKSIENDNNKFKKTVFKGMRK